MADMVNHPAHYTRGPTVTCPECNHSRVLEAIEVIRYIKDFRLATAVKYLWRVGFGGKANDVEDVNKAVWYAKDYTENPLVEIATGSAGSDHRGVGTAQG